MKKIVVYLSLAIVAILIGVGIGVVATTVTNENPLIKVTDNTDHITVLDTDPGIDDAIAILLCHKELGEPDIYVATQGNIPSLLTRINLALIKDTLGLNGKIGYGTPLLNTSDVYYYDGFSGPDGLGGEVEKALVSSFNNNFWQFFHLISICFGSLTGLNADYPDIDAIAEELLKHDAITYITIGPSTTLANLLTKYPALAKKIDSVYVMGGGFEVTNAPHNSEFNLASNPKASKIVLSSGLDITIVPLDAISKYGSITKHDIEKYLNSGEYQIAANILRFEYNQTLSYGQGENAPMYDPVAVTVAKYPELFTTRDTKISIDEYGHIEEADEGYPVHVVTAFDKDLMRMLLNAVYEIPNS